MFYYNKFNCNPHYPNRDLQDWMKENFVTIHRVKDAGMYGNIHVFYSAPFLTSGMVRVASGYQSSHGSANVSFSDKDPIKGVAK